MMSETLEIAMSNNPHLEEYLRDYPEVEYVKVLKQEYTDNKKKYGKEKESYNFVYPVGDPMFIHIYTPHPNSTPRYHVVEPNLPEQWEKYDNILDRMLRMAPRETSYETREEFEDMLDSLLERITVVGPRINAIDRIKGKIPVTEDELEIIKYKLTRDIIENSIIEPLIRDPNIEDIHAIGLGMIHIVHRHLGMLETNLRFKSTSILDHFLRNLSERLGNPVSESNPIVDSAMPDGSRINIVYSRDVSIEGSSFTIRKFSDKPPPITRLVELGTFSPEMAAYLWLALESGMSLVVSGETASGKTTTLNALISMINFSNKIYSAEDTPEIVVPHPVWQRLLTREKGTGVQLELFDLVKTALRSRPDFLIIGEVRGREGTAAFQALQTGHSVLTTFHASSISKMIQRFTGDPINIPMRFMDNLNIALFQEIIIKDRTVMRRCTSIQEIIKYSKEKDGVMTREVFTWDPHLDQHTFLGRNNSYILSSKVAPKMQVHDPKAIYKELDVRASIIQGMIDHNILDYDSFNEIMKSYFEKGWDGIPFEMRGYKG